MKHWIARVDPQFSVGGHTSGGTVERIGTVNLNGIVTEAGVHDGREITVRISPDVLDIVAQIVADAIASRDAAAVQR
jgi:hypothetical protein